MDIVDELRLKNSQLTDEAADEIEKLRAAIVELEKQEPVAWMYPSDLERFQESETFAQAFSISVGSPNETSVPLYTAPVAPAEQEPVKLLCKGTRFKTYLTADRGVVLEGLPRELSGMWVALIEATDDCHMSLTAPVAPAGWQPIETAPKTGRTILLGYFSSHGNWRTMRGQWFSAEVVAETFEELDHEDDPVDFEGWYETSVEADDVPNCWITEPSHWMPLPAAPEYGK